MIAQLLVYVLVSGSLATILSQLLKRHLPLSYRRNGLAFLLAGGNSAVIGVALLQGEALRPPLEQLAYSIAAGAAFAGLLLAFAALRQRLTLNDIPAPFRGPAVELLSLGHTGHESAGHGGAVLNASGYPPPSLTACRRHTAGAVSVMAWHQALGLLATTTPPSATSDRHHQRAAAANPVRPLQL